VKRHEWEVRLVLAAHDQSMDLAVGLAPVDAPYPKNNHAQGMKFGATTVDLHKRGPPTFFMLQALP
jgi:hypothetical protein